MEILIFWLGTSIISFSMDIALCLGMFKDIADNGYKMDLDRITELGKQFDSNPFLTLLIPGFNVIDGFTRLIQYNNARSMMLTQLSMMGLLEKMNEEEIQEYLNNPTGLNALLIQLKELIRLEKATSIEIKEKYGDKDKLVEAIKNNSNFKIDSNSSEIKEEITETSQVLSDKKQELKNLKSELLEEKQRLQKSNTENELTLIKKRK